MRAILFDNMNNLNLSSIKDWPVLSALKLPLNVFSVKLIYVFGKTGEDVLIVTIDDEVYSFGSNSDGGLGLGHSGPVLEPTKVDELCQKQIQCVVSSHCNSGYNYVLALTESGQTYAWGSNKSKCLGNDGSNDSYKPTLITALNGIRVVDVCCSYHCLALTQSGEVYSWGYNGYGAVGIGNNNTPQIVPLKVTALKGHKIIAIACGRNHSLSLTDAGVVYGWGHNGFGELGVGNNNNQNLPIRLALDVKVAKIRAGLHHTLLLTTGGDVYACGFNNSGQLGDRSTSNKLSPTMVELNTKIADILSLAGYHVSMALSNDGKCFVWGVNGFVFPEPVTQTCFTDAFHFYMNIKLTIRPIKCDKASLQSLMSKRFSKCFDDRDYSDIKFRVDGKYVYAQKLYLRGVCKHFDDMFSDNHWLESNTSEIEITQYSYSVFYAFLKYLYTNEVDIRPDEAIDLLDLANSYFEEELKLECNKIIINSISIENFCQIYSSALVFNLTELEEYCVNFAADKMQLICETSGFALLNEIPVKKLVRRYFASIS